MYPKDGATQVSTNPLLVAKVDDPEEDDMNVSFYDGNGNYIGSDTQVTGGRAAVEWTGLSASTSYSWHAEADDGNYVVSSTTFSFTTGQDAPDQFNPYRNFEHRQAINLTDFSWSPGYSSNAVSEFKLDTATPISENKMNPYCTDLRFADADGTTILEYWVNRSTCDTASTEFLVDIPDDQIPLKQANPVYVYYGNDTMESGFNYTVRQQYLLDRPSPTSNGLSTYHRCWVEKPAGKLYCSGRNNYGQLGDGSTTNSNTPVRAGSLTDVEGVATGQYHTCAFTNSGQLYCWGRNNYGQLGDGSTTNSQTPVKVPGMENVVELAIGDYHTCALEEGGQVSCWGRNSYGETGRPFQYNRPAEVGVGEGLQEASSISAGAYYTCAVGRGNQAYCWGRNNYGQLGDGTTGNTNTPVAVHSGEGLGNAVDIESASQASCAIEDTGDAFCWGRGTSGQLGYGSTSNSNTPVLVHAGDGLNNSYEIAMGPNYHVCALDTDGQMLCWGDPTTIPGASSDQSTPYLVSNTGEGLDDPVAIGGGYNSMCAIDTTGESYCWGTNYYGEFGTGDTTDYSNPAQTHDYWLGGFMDRKPGDIKNIPALTDTYGVKGFNTLSDGPEQSWLRISGMTLSDLQVY